MGQTAHAVLGNSPARAFTQCASTRKASSPSFQGVHSSIRPHSAGSTAEKKTNCYQRHRGGSSQQGARQAIAFTKSPARSRGGAFFVGRRRVSARGFSHLICFLSVLPVIANLCLQVSFPCPGGRDAVLHTRGLPDLPFRLPRKRQVHRGPLLVPRWLARAVLRNL